MKQREDDVEALTKVLAEKAGGQAGVWRGTVMVMLDALPALGWRRVEQATEFPGRLASEEEPISSEASTLAPVIVAGRVALRGLLGDGLPCETRGSGSATYCKVTTQEMFGCLRCRACQSARDAARSNALPGLLYALDTAEAEIDRLRKLLGQALAAQLPACAGDAGCEGTCFICEAKAVLMETP